MDAPSVVVLPRTPSLLLGPYYPVRPTGPASDRLWRGTPAEARRPLRLEGRVCSRSGRPLANAWVELWQADEEGRYPHPDAPDAAEVDRRFSGYGAMRCDSEGRFAFATVVPGAYGGGERLRAPHLHLQVTTLEARLVTQLFLPAHPLNGRDRWLQAASAPERLVLRRHDDGCPTLRLAGDIVMTAG